jgi:3-oxoadipate enol-lactonase
VTEVRLADGGRIAVTVQGSGPPLLLLRPLGGSVVSWGPFADALARRMRVIAFDPRGVGASTPPPLGTTTRDMARDAKTVLDALDVPCAHVYGISLGGMVATWLAVDAPERVDRLVLASTPPHGLALGLAGWGRGIALARCLLHRPPDAEACLATYVLSDRFRRERPDAVAQIQSRARARPASHRTLLVMLAAAARHDVGARLADVGSTTLALRGDCDALLDAEAPRDLARRLRYGRIVSVAGVGHDLSAEAPDEIAALVLEHLEQAETRAHRSSR